MRVGYQILSTYENPPITLILGKLGWCEPVEDETWWREHSPYVIKVRFEGVSWLSITIKEEG